jgi:response regulator NasT
MPRDKDIQHSILIVSSSDRFALLVKRSLKNYITIDTAKSSSLARRYILEKDYALVVIDSPLPDETGEDLALDITERRDASVMLVAPEEISGFVMENAADHGILVVRKPAPAGQIDKAIRSLTAVQNKMVRLKQKTRKVEEKLEETEVI